VDAAAFIA